MPLACPNCGSRYLRDSQPRDTSERISRLWFVAPLRCLDCHTRFIMRTVILADLMYARCPRCFRMDLAKWQSETFEPSLTMRIKLNMGANRWRCEYCRLNFASFRQRSEIFTFKRWKNRNAGEARAEGRARIAERQGEKEAELRVPGIGVSYNRTEEKEGK